MSYQGDLAVPGPQHFLKEMVFVGEGQNQEFGTGR